MISRPRRVKVDRRPVETPGEIVGWGTTLRTKRRFMEKLSYSSTFG